MHFFVDYSINRILSGVVVGKTLKIEGREVGAKCAQRASKA